MVLIFFCSAWVNTPDKFLIWNIGLGILCYFFHCFLVWRYDHFCLLHLKELCLHNFWYYCFDWLYIFGHLAKIVISSSGVVMFICFSLYNVQDSAGTSFPSLSQMTWCSYSGYHKPFACKYVVSVQPIFSYQLKVRYLILNWSVMSDAFLCPCWFKVIHCSFRYNKLWGSRIYSSSCELHHKLHNAGLQVPSGCSFA